MIKSVNWTVRLAKALKINHFIKLKEKKMLQAEY